MVVGAGIAGLTAAFRLQQAGCAVHVLERAGPERVGGRMASVLRDGYHLDLGGPLLARRYRRMLALAADAGIAADVLPARDEVAVRCSSRTVRGRTGSLPRLLRGGLLHAVGARERLRLLDDMRRMRPLIGAADMSAAAAARPESVAAYARRRGFSEDALRHVLEPLNATMTLADPEETAAATPFLMLMFYAASGGLFTFPTGSGFLPQHLARQVPVTYDAEALSVAETPGGVEVVWRDARGTQRHRSADGAVLAVPVDRVPALYDALPVGQRDHFSAARYAHLLQITFCLSRPTTESAVVLYTSRTELPDIAAFILQHNMNPGRVPAGCGLVTTYLHDHVSRARWRWDDTRIVDRVLEDIHRLGVLPETQRHLVAAHVDRIRPSVLVRGPRDYRALAQVRHAASASGRVCLAGADFFGHSTTIGSLTSGEQAAVRLLALLDRPPTQGK